jgi:ATP-dependent DNA helicase RecG
MLINFATAELADVVQRTDAETRNLLTRLVERGWVQPRGEGKPRTGTCPRRSTACWTRRRVTRKQVAEFCGLSPDQADRVLRGRVAAGTLARQAVNKGRFYTLAAKPGH